MYKITLQWILNAEPFRKKKGYRGKRSKKYKTFCVTFDIILKRLLRTDYKANLFGVF